MQANINQWFVSQELSVMLTEWEVVYVGKTCGKNVTIQAKTVAKCKHIRITVSQLPYIWHFITFENIWGLD